MRVTIIGAGPAGLMAAWVLAPHAEVDLYDANKAPGRKFLVAGQGGFNLTNELDGAELQGRYSPTGFLDRALEGMGSGQLRQRLLDLGIATYVGSSGRVFPLRGTKPITVLQALLDRLEQLGVRIHAHHRFMGFDPALRPQVEGPVGHRVLEGDAVFLALGGASWPVTGSTGDWTRALEAIGVPVLPFHASNCGVEVPWPATLVTAHAGKPLKNIRLSAGGLSVRGEATITAHGLEGNAIYPVLPACRADLVAGRPTGVELDLKPDVERSVLEERLRTERDVAMALRLDRAAMAVLKAFTTKEELFEPVRLADRVKALRLPVKALRPLEVAISSVGGVPVTELEEDFSLRRHPRIFTIGEMVDWDAPTGGFLLQGCFAMGHHAASRWLEGAR